MPTINPGDAGDSTSQQRLESLGYSQELNRTMSLRDVVVYGLIYMCPMAPVSVFGYIYNLSHGMVAMVYIAAAVTMYFSAVSYCEMAKEFPVAGSVYSYVRFGSGKFIGFLSGWAILLDYLLLPALLLIFASAAMHVQMPAIPQWAWVPLFVVISTIVNLRGIAFASWMNLTCLYIQLAVIVLFAAVVVIASLRGTAHLGFDPLFRQEEFSIKTIFSAIPIAALSYLGFDAISTLNEEAKGGGKTVSSATMIVLVMIAGLFVLQVYLAAALVPSGSTFNAQTADTAFYDVATLAAGPWFRVVITITTAVIAMLANALVSQATTARLIFSMARDRQLPRVLAVVDPKSKVPTRAILLVAGLSAIIGIAAVEKAELVTSLVTFGSLTAYVLLHVAVVCHFRRGHAQVSLYKHRVVPVIGLSLLAYALWSAPVPAKVLAVIWLLLGVAVQKLGHDAAFESTASDMANRRP